jgi:hypothetical protein
MVSLTEQPLFTGLKRPKLTFLRRETVFESKCEKGVKQGSLNASPKLTFFFWGGVMTFWKDGLNTCFD